MHHKLGRYYEHALSSRLAIALVCFMIGVGCNQPDDETIDFGAVRTGMTSDKSFSITNTGRGRLHGSVAIPEGCEDFTIIAGVGSYTLAENGPPHDVTVRFSPASIGSKVCMMDIGPDCGSVMLNGFGGNIIILSPIAITVWDVGQQASIQWDSDLGGNVQITLSRNGGSFIVLSGLGNILNDGNAQVMVSNPPSDARIRIQSLTYPEVSVVSQTFRIN